MNQPRPKFANEPQNTQTQTPQNEQTDLPSPAIFSVNYTEPRNCSNQETITITRTQQQEHKSDPNQKQKTISKIEKKFEKKKSLPRNPYKNLDFSCLDSWCQISIRARPPGYLPHSVFSTIPTTPTTKSDFSGAALEHCSQPSPSHCS